MPMKISQSKPLARPNSSIPSSRMQYKSQKSGNQVFERPTKRARIDIRGHSSGSGSSSTDSDGEESADEDEKALKAVRLAALEAHSRALLGLPPLAGPSGRQDAEEEDDDEEGEGEGSSDDSEDNEVDSEGFASDDGWGAEDGFVTDSEDEFANTKVKPSKAESMPEIEKPEAIRVPEIVFDPSTSGSSAPTTMASAERRAFLTGNSAKMMGISSVPDYLPGRARTKPATAEDIDDANNESLDKTLHSMLLTTLLPSHSASTAARPVDKRNAMQGRLLELANFELPGEGAKTVKGGLLGKHSAKIRTGLVHKQQKRDKAARQEAIESGNMVRGVGGLGEGLKKGAQRGEQRASMGEDVGKKKGMESRKKDDSGRSRGLQMGVGRFAGGVLKLSESDIARVNGPGDDGGRKGKGKGKGGGKGGGKGKGKKGW